VQSLTVSRAGRRSALRAWPLDQLRSRPVRQKHWSRGSRHRPRSGSARRRRRLFTLSSTSRCGGAACHAARRSPPYVQPSMATGASST
jgi:hypothetical protein